MTSPETSTAPVTRTQPTLEQNPIIGGVELSAKEAFVLWFLAAVMGAVLSNLISAASLKWLTEDEPEEPEAVQTQVGGRAYDICVQGNGVVLDYCIPADEPMFRRLDHTGSEMHIEHMPRGFDP